MGIDPVTHEPLHKETQTSETSSSSLNENSPGTEKNKSLPCENTDTSGISKENSSFSQTENTSSINDKPNPLFQSLCDDENLLSYLLCDNEPPLVDVSNWELFNHEKKSKSCTSVFASWDDCATWLMDCQDFGVNDFGLDFFNEVEMSFANTLEMDYKKE